MHELSLMTVKDFFANVAATGFLDELRAVSATYRYRIRGAGHYRVTVHHGTVLVREGDGDADCTLSCDEGDFLDLVVGRRNALTTLMQGRLAYRGPIHHLLNQAPIFRAGLALAQPASVSEGATP